MLIISHIHVQKFSVGVQPVRSQMMLEKEKSIGQKKKKDKKRRESYAKKYKQKKREKKVEILNMDACFGNYNSYLLTFLFYRLVLSQFHQL